MQYREEIQEIWDRVKNSLADELPSDIVDYYLSDLKVIGFNGSEVVLGTESEFKKMMIEKNDYNSKIADIFERYFGNHIGVIVEYIGTPQPNSVFDRVKREAERENAILKQQKEEGNRRPVTENKPTPVIGGTIPPFNFNYTFENFIVGSTNKFAHAACTAVAANPAMDYNPLFIYGPSGLGKTHLLYAITNEVKKKKPDVNIIYITGEDFTNQMIESLSRHQMSEFHDKYRSCDMLLIDDIQFIAGKVGTQEEFFHTFNALYEDHKQIILTSDRPPREIKTLEDRLKTRFEWGLLADIQPPDLELRVAIIKKKAEQVGISIPDDVLTYLAENLRSNIRQIEGAVKKFAALSFLGGKAINMETAEGCISELLGGAEPTSVTIDKIFAAVTSKYGISRDDIVSLKRNKEIALPRHICNYLIREITEMSYPNIAKIFNRNHSTVMTSCDNVEKKMLNDKMFELEIRALKREITGIDDNAY